MVITVSWAGSIVPYLNHHSMDSKMLGTAALVHTGAVVQGALSPHCSSCHPSGWAIVSLWPRCCIGVGYALGRRF